MGLYDKFPSGGSPSEFIAWVEERNQQFNERLTALEEEMKQAVIEMAHAAVKALSPEAQLRFNEWKKQQEKE